MKLTILKTCFLAGVLSIFSGCQDYLDVNTDPNNPNPDQVGVESALATATGYTAYSLGNPYQILGGMWSQYWTQGPTASQYLTIDQYAIDNTDFNRPWTDFYAGVLEDCTFIIQKGTTTGQTNYVAIAKILQAYSFQLLTDLHGDIPFTEALQGDNNLSPRFDEQSVVYDGLLRLVNEGLDSIDVESSIHPAADDLFYGGDMVLWQKFANTLKLKILLRQAYVRPDVAQANIQQMFASGSEFLGAGEDAQVAFQNVIFNRNPLYASMVALTPDNLLASETVIDYLTATQDPRIDMFFVPSTAGVHVGILQGNAQNLPVPQNANNYSKPSPLVGGLVVSGSTEGASAPVIVMSAAESLLLQAEAVVRGWAPGDAATLFSQAIDASFAYWGLTPDDAAVYRANVPFPAGGGEEQIKAIITQKWASMTGTQGAEAWIEWRRTGYPDFFSISATSSIGQRFPARNFYPDTEQTTNPNTPPQKQIFEKVWWDVNTTGQN